MGGEEALTRSVRTAVSRLMVVWSSSSAVPLPGDWLNVPSFDLMVTTSSPLTPRMAYAQSARSMPPLSMVIALPAPSMTLLNRTRTCWRS
ncbi:hypothetical protein [Dactylosporangium sp. NPDC006015]|uniref:hypothetical protein n=1 Tax=Dactylosporangium sp. NPDC006015 TaxID=3154576 RepID=UPI0033B1470E